jgi:hypothetical protein
MKHGGLKFENRLYLLEIGVVISVDAEQLPGRPYTLRHELEEISKVAVLILSSDVL